MKVEIEIDRRFLSLKNVLLNFRRTEQAVLNL